MNRSFLWTCGLALIPATNIVGQSKAGPLEGVWQTVQVTMGGTQPATMKPGANLAIFSGRHYSRVEVHTEKTRPVLANPATATADELREVWGPFVAEAGTYELSGDQLTLHPIVSKNPAAMAAGVSVVYSCKLDGKTATLTAQRDLRGPVANPFTVKLERIE